MNIKQFYTVPQHTTVQDAALLLIRVVAGIAFMYHGWGKIQNPFAWMGPDSTTPAVLQGLSALSEFGGGLAWVIGLLTPLASLGIAFTMATAVYFHAVIFGDPFVKMTAEGGSYEPASMFFCIAIVLIAMGPGRFSLDRKIFGPR